MQEALVNLEQVYEHVTRHAWRLGRPQKCLPRPKRAWPVPVVLVGGAGPPLHLLLGLLRTRVEAAIAARVPARTYIRARSGRMRSLWS